jgi:TonB family protein
VLSRDPPEENSVYETAFLASNDNYWPLFASMFTPLNGGISRLQAKNLGMSLLLHGLLLGWLLHSPYPRFLAPSSVAYGEYGSVTHLYWPGPLTEGRTDAKTSPARRQSEALRRLTWNKSHKLKKPPKTVAPSAVLEAAIQAGESNPASSTPPAGAPYGSLTDGPATGDEVLPALPVSATDPVVGPNDLAGHGEGSVVVEITIDDKGNIVQKTVLQSLGPLVDAKVLAALENWHFSPATRNGVAIPSKQDVYYHFKPRA